eukprot:GHVU01197159.1.p3 GENE.GHVU01197159.1~~GHVU01197159.1.p3  ORF type:complete len:103 (-),score=4.66 GHVU01197159.1:3226-3534(-)
MSYEFDLRQLIPNDSFAAASESRSLKSRSRSNVNLLRATRVFPPRSCHTQSFYHRRELRKITISASEKRLISEDSSAKRYFRLGTCWRWPLQQCMAHAFFGL